MTGDHFFWITSRAAGLVALLAASAAVTAGLLMGGRFVKGRGAQLRVTHEALALTTLAAIALHAGALLADGFLHPSLADITIPFVSGYQRAWTTLGILSGWALVLLGLSYYARTRIGAARWRRLHRFTALAWLLAVVHGLLEGTDAGSGRFLATVAAAVLPAFALLTLRYAEPPRRAVAPR